MLTSPFRKWVSASIALGGSCLLLIIDAETPIGLAIPFAYILLAPFIVALRNRRVSAVAVFAMSAISFLGLWVSKAGVGAFLTDFYQYDNQLRDAVLNRIMAIILFIAVIWLLRRIQTTQDELHRLSTTDSMTGALNRRRFEELAELERRRAQRNGFPLSILILDIDHFKSVNDRFGHHTGDAAIRMLANVSLATLRPADLFSRWGGEEFVVAMPETNAAGVKKAAERLREMIAAARFEAAGKTHSVTVSIGVTTMLREELSIAHAIGRADRALYRAKQAGRNRVEAEGV
jgi:diguanylate cyclase (GGDEF)-like protein